MLWTKKLISSKVWLPHPKFLQSLWNIVKHGFVACMKNTGAIFLNFWNQTLLMMGLYLKWKTTHGKIWTCTFNLDSLYIAMILTVFDIIMGLGIICLKGKKTLHLYFWLMITVLLIALFLSSTSSFFCLSLFASQIFKGQPFWQNFTPCPWPLLLTPLDIILIQYETSYYTHVTDSSSPSWLTVTFISIDLVYTLTIYTWSTGTFINVWKKEKLLLMFIWFLYWC